jgi:hypothetical protein
LGVIPVRGSGCQRAVARAAYLVTKEHGTVAIDIDKLTEAELIDLNNRIVARLKFLQQMRAHASMLEFSIGERVSFQPEGHPVLHGIITRYNRKSVTVITENGQHWNVAPIFLSKASAAPAAASAAPSGKVVSLPRK